MARKLKSDKLLFTSTLVLVCASLVMVYSASAVIGMEQYHQRPTLFLVKQGADPLLKNGEGLTAARIAERADHAAIAQAIDKSVKQSR